VKREQIPDQNLESVRMRIHGIDGLTLAEIEEELAAGGRFVRYEYCISLLFATLRKPTGLYFLRPEELGLVRGLPFALLSLLLGWWGIPWGVIYTPLTLITNLSGGCDATAEVWAWLQNTAARSSPLGDNVNP
jgi:hypothetical protein